jgi:peptidoglycan/LPS O-acetylase OafA/YrhL
MYHRMTELPMHHGYLSSPLHATYRKDIDGLRALAVLAVVAFHAFPQVLPGGFVGVDVFFVISGYLISGILFSDLQRGQFTYR